ncbi:nucleotide exchange factor SIL1-like isoform X2 [Homarus americanus]|nr:nucleotide exchange factor SIL1-like isoform X2 [Homarus americanus]
MNLATGLKEAKLLDGDDGTDYEKSLERLRKTGHTGVTGAGVSSNTPTPEAPPTDDQDEEYPRAALMRDNILEALKNIKSEDGLTPEELSEEAANTKGKFRSYGELKRDFKELNIAVETDSEIMTKLMKQYRDSDDDRVTILEDLEYLVHQFDNAITFVDMGGLQQIVVTGVNASSSAIKKGALHLLGSAVQSNPKVQIAAVEAGLVQALIRAVAYDTQEGVARKAVYALSCLVRGFPFGQQVLVQHGGLEVLRKVFDRKDYLSLPLQLKVVSLLHDLLVEREEAQGERLKQLLRLNINEQLSTGGWCPAVSSLLAAASFDRRDRRYDMGAALRNEMPLRPDHDTVDKVVSAMGRMVNVCRYQFYDALPLLRHLAHTYNDLAYKEQFQDDNDEGHVFKSIADMIQRLLKNIGQRNEL